MISDTWFQQESMAMGEFRKTCGRPITYNCGQEGKIQASFAVNGKSRDLTLYTCLMKNSCAIDVSIFLYMLSAHPMRYTLTYPNTHHQILNTTHHRHSPSHPETQLQLSPSPFHSHARSP